ncbi:hypothetical protein [Pelagibaculum spongiae]|uniref:Isochorismatase-like domain-containing protein n=1 Tax=Pelagibaculum spongiae TaxID=2080658 RepID=A0A2V1GTL1_9GAMM|nr:hypothetical protein [Pelagibaculum spongiae]PVZ68948.1 hypothetical protein DC094_11930 [Pelagibaculum spongiae]
MDSQNNSAQTEPRTLQSKILGVLREEAKVCGVIIDESDRDDMITNNQISILHTLKRLQQPTLMISMNPKIINDTHEIVIGQNVNIEQLTLVNRVCNKSGVNPFDSITSPNLLQMLKIMGVQPGRDYLLLMGYSADCCVKATAVGFESSAEKNQSKGAVHLGYKVLTSPCLLHYANEAWDYTEPSWCDCDGVFSYRQLF